MAVDVTATLRRQDIGDLMRAMERARKEVGKSLGNSVKFAGWAVADALRTAARVSPKKRPVRLDDERMADPAQKRYARGLKPFLAERVHYRKGRYDIPFRAAGLREAKASKWAKIGNSGLAARTWHAAQSRLGSGRGGKKVEPYTQGLAQQFGSVTLRVKGDDPFVRIDNRLPYAAAAFKGDGEQTVSNVMERAARRMMHVIDGQIAKKMGAR
jgi:hypothetical protein